ncbi:MAG TPA: zinc ribbon domain-containing protein [Thermoplasmata archaeon]|nr:zinc ribbon domain-containing protein [Thermoplasmata archaeon]
MSNRASRNNVALRVLIVWSLALAGLFATVLAPAPSVQAAVCDQVGGVITGDWTITTVQTCTGIVYTVDGTININAGGSLTLVDGGLKFAKDTAHAGYALNVNAGGELVLDNSIVTTETNAISPYVKLALTVSGAGSRFTMRDGASLKFPGWFNATSATINMTDSTITGFTDADIVNLGVDMDDNNDAPAIAWASTSASMYGSRIERLYEYVSVGNGTGTGVSSLTASSTLYAYDTYVGVDYSDLADRHNELRVDGTSNAYLYNVTIDRTQDPGSQTDWQPAFVPTAAGGSVYLLRWLHLTVLDSTAFPVSGAAITSTLSPSATLAQYPDNGLATTPSSRTLWYLGRAASGTNAWDVTDASGTATIPLYTDQITLASLPNAESFGNYEEAADFSTSTTTGGAFFPAYPSISEEDNNLAVSLVFSDLRVRTLPDLELRQSEYTGTLTVIQNQPFTVYARIYNSGQTDATGVSVAAYLDGIPPEVARADGLAVPAGPAVVNRTLNVGALATTGPHTLMLWVDPGNTIDEGGSAQENNNFVNITLNVVPPPEGFIAIATPGSNQRVEPGSALSVTGYVRDTDQNPLLGVPLRIELRSGATVYANTTATSSDVGFFVGTINVPASIQEGGYTLVVAPASGSIQSDSRPIAVQRSLPILYQPVPFIGLPYWLFLSIIGAVAAVVIGVTAYWKVYGLGKMVECGECGAFIPEDATACPKCGVEFEKDMAKCSNCQTWIPVDVKRCPECGVEFATGELEMADYQEKMRLQYDEVVTKFKDEAGRQLGRALSDREFQEWWRKQPTFVTFEDWLREEEDMRKMGSKPCPVCGTLNSVTATVCHKCGSLMKETRPPGGGGGGVIAGPPAPRPSSGGGIPPPDDTVGRGAAPYGGGAAAGTETIPHRVIRKPVSQQPVVQKKVVRKPTEGQGSEGSEGQSEGSGDDL